MSEKIKVSMVAVSKLKPYDKNPRKNDEAVDAVAASIKEFGFQQPLVVDSQNVIIVGHTRLKAALKLGLTEVPVIVADHLNADQAKAFRILDNKVGEKAKWDFELLQFELKDLDLTHEAMALAFDKSELDIIMQAAWEPKTNVEDPTAGNAPGEGKKADAIAVTEEQRETIDRAIERCRELAEDKTLSEGRCVELICADYNAGN
jgi:ParB/RepB/Spo0J family partition protein